MMIIPLLSTVFVTLFVATTTAVDNLAFVRNEYSIKVTGQQNVPKYMVTSAASNSTYKIMYQKIYESDAPGNKVGKPISLPSLKWAFEVDQADLNVFWIRNTGVNGNGQTPPWTKLEFKNTLFNNTVKFDVILNGYQWGSNDATALNFAWKFSATKDEAEDVAEGEPGLSPDEATTTGLCFGNSTTMCFDIQGKANVTDSAGALTEIDVKLGFDGSEGVVISYKRFAGDLYHDPSFGFSSEDGGECDGIIGAILCFFASIFFCFL